MGAGFTGRGVGPRGDVELERVHQLVADHVIGVGERTAHRQDDAAPDRFGDAAGAFADLARDGVGLLEVGMRRVEHERLAAAQLVAEHLLQARVPALGHARGDVDAFASRSDRSRCRSARSSGPGSRGSCTGPCCGRSTAPTHPVPSGRRRLPPPPPAGYAQSSRRSQLHLVQIDRRFARSGSAAQYFSIAPATSRRASASARSRSALVTASARRPPRYLTNQVLDRDRDQLTRR